MSSEDDNALKDVDLSAWDVPPPESDADELADSVIARVAGTEVGAAIPVEEPSMSGRKRALLIAGVAAAVLAVVAGGWAIVKGTRHVAPASGEVVAQKAQSLELDVARADLDSGADVKWSRKGGVLRVEQTGNAAWHVGTDSKLVIDVGPGQGISTGAALASVEATGASLRVEVTPMNAADAKIAGVVASTAAAVALVTVVVYDGHVKVRDGSTTQTVIVQPGTTYKVTPPPDPIPIVDDDESTQDDTPVVGVAPVAADEPPEVQLVAGDDVIIHDMSPPTRVKIDMTKACHGNAQLVVNGVTTSGDTFAFNRGNVKYNVMCDDLDVAEGSVTVTRDSLTKPLPPPPAVNSVTADGRTYNISFQSMPALEVHGGPGTLHLAHGTVEKTYVARGESVLVPSVDLEAGEYRYWFKPDVMSQLKLSLDTGAPIIWLDTLTWGAQVPFQGATLPGTTLSVDGIAIPVDGTGRFKATLPGGDVIVARLEHPSAGLQYAIARSTTATTTPANPVTVSQSGFLDRAAISKVMGSLKGKFASCVQSNPPTTRGIVKLKVFVQPDGQVSRTDVAQGIQATLDQCLKAAVEKTAFPAAKQTTVFMYPVVVEPPTTTSSGKCDADALKDKGMEALNLGKHEMALSLFEASIACKSDSYVVSLAFMAACNAKDKVAAAKYWPKLSPAQQTKFKQVCIRNSIDPTTLITARAVPAPACDADAAKDKGMENVNMGQHAAALAQFEASLRCKEDPYVVSLAFMAACSAQNAGKAKLYWKKMSGPQQSKFRQLCVRNHIDPTDGDDDDTTVAAPNICDADALKDKGMENVNMGQHAAALGNFEASLRCKEDNYVRSLAFMAACNAQNAGKAKQHYAKLNQSQQEKFVQMCYRNRIDPETGGVYLGDDEKGYLQINSMPAAKVLIDGVDTGLTTPVSGKKLPLTPGKHKVTLEIGDDRFAYPVVIKAGKTETMSKDLR